jgi:hypothetical protein
MRTGATHRLAGRARPSAGGERRLVLLTGGAGNEAVESAERTWLGRYVLRPRDGGFAARWAAALAGSAGPLRECERWEASRRLRRAPRPIPRRPSAVPRRG